MAHHPDDRFESAQAMRDALEHFLDRFSRRVGSREVGELVSDMFASERDRIRGIIDEQMKQLLRETAQTLPVPTLELWANAVDHTPTAVSGRRRAADLTGPSGLHGSDSTPSSSSTSHGTLVGTGLSTAPPGQRKRTTLIVGLAAVTISVIGVALAVLFVGAEGDTNVATPSPSADAPPTESSAGAEQTIVLEIRYAPPSATAKLDGVSLAQSPFVAQMPRDGTAHTLEVSAPGHVTQTTMLSYDRDIDLSIELDEAAPPADPTASASAEPKPVAGPRPPVPGPKPAPPSGDDGKQPLKIDEEDPYGK